MDNIKQVVKDIRFLIATDCCDETIQARIENFINETKALCIHDVVGRSEQLVCPHCKGLEVYIDEYGGKPCMCTKQAN